jgi:acyl-CoA synthetase (AMP-forming)/AMP-acid ligase II
MKVIPGSIGVLVPGIEARILRDDGSSVGVNEAGELWFKGGNVALGYLNNEQADKETFVDGWVKTGDKFYVNEEGYFLCVVSLDLSCRRSFLYVLPVSHRVVSRIALRFVTSINLG